jgi:hypothetical protein
MPQPDARIESNCLADDGRFNARSMRDTQTANEKLYGPDHINPLEFRKPEYYVYIFSVVDPRPTGAKLVRMFPPLLAKLEIAELDPAKSDKYTLVIRLAHPINQYCMRENGERYIDSHDARRLAQDIVNPDNLTLNQDYKIDATRVYSMGNDYGRLGVFWSLNEKPTYEEIKKAVQRKEAYYRARLQEASILEMTAPRRLADYLTINDHIAADYFGQEFSWHKHQVRGETCPNCGEQIKPGVAFHKSAVLDGNLCILDWRRAVETGVRKREDVPYEARWFNEKDLKKSSPGGAASSS